MSGKRLGRQLSVGAVAFGICKVYEVIVLTVLSCCIMFTFIVTGRGRPGHDQHPSLSRKRSSADTVEVNSERERYAIFYMQQDLGGDKMHFPETLLKELLCCKMLPTTLILHLKMEPLKTPPVLQRRRLFRNQDQCHYPKAAECQRRTYIIKGKA